MAPEKKSMVYARSRAEWRKWLEKNHSKEKFVWLVVYKVHTGKPGLKHRESMEEAICFGWIDTIIKRLDEDRYLRGFARRSDKGKWSANTRGYAKELIQQGRMAAAGLKAYKDGLKRPTHDHGLAKNPKMPEDLRKALNESNAAKNFESFAPSYKRTYLRWLERAKLPETRAKRISEVVKRAAQNRKAF